MAFHSSIWISIWSITCYWKRYSMDRLVIYSSLQYSWNYVCICLCKI